MVQSATKTPSFNCGIDKGLSQKSHKLPCMGSNPIPAIFYLTLNKNFHNIKIMNDTINLNSRNTPTIHQMRRAGWKVRVIHGEMETPLSDRFTRIELTSPDGKDATGIAYCSKGDQWDRKLGNRIALGRALKNYQSI